MLGTISILSSLFDRTRRSAIAARGCGRGSSCGRPACACTSRARALDPSQATSSRRTIRASTTSRSCSRRCRCSCGSSPRTSLGRFPFLGWHLRRTGHLLVDRKNPGAGIVEEDGAAGRESAFAHRVSRRDAQRRRPRRAVQEGMFLVAIDAGLPIVPVSVAGSRHVMLKGG